MRKKISRPVWLSPLQVWLPLSGLLSLLHRVSGVLLFLLLPLFVYLFGESLASPDSYASLTRHPPFWLKLLALLTAWAFVHHVLAGGRLLLMDIGVGNALNVSRRTARWVFWLELLVLVSLGVWLC